MTSVADAGADADVDAHGSLGAAAGAAAANWSLCDRRDRGDLPRHLRKKKRRSRAVVPLLLPAMMLLLFILEDGARLVSEGRSENLSGVTVLSVVSAIAIEPGMGFQTARGTASKPVEKVVIFEHTNEYGSGGLVYNCPTPIRLKDLNIPKFMPFGNHALYLGSGISPYGEEGEGEGDEEEDDGEDGSNVPLGDMAPWFWLHNVPDLTGSSSSTQLYGSSGPLYMGGNLESALQRIQSDQGVPPLFPFGSSKYRFKFFTRYRKWGPGQLESELGRRGGDRMWTDLTPLDPDDVLTD